ncbi:phosphatidylserine decarboxylase [Candidatus Bandiella euplotis]|uniref:Phosphatidylserine decarboxylase proenzyme n=1 Tax=Candidatus Bandiella euplotis TaxID=1664265 RepID=A0ABZ0USL8_9RICK|nr:phosphatidylserine decarboxylase [Candidatus Bandiella woodruffii]WPX97055.1 Phosphatidylserine decarboxylase proenzyme [Candidatus Bandiella woodruffii]
MFESIRDFMPGIHREGYFFISIFVIVTVVFFALSAPLGWMGVVPTAWCIFFFRDPERVIPTQENLLISPADGVVQRITKSKLPKEIADTDEEMTRVSIFLNVFNVHVNRIPTNGVVKKLHYHHGKFFNASLDKASEHNERQSVLIETKDGQKIGVVQIAGLIARRIVCDLEDNQEVETGARFGIIRFGSRVDVYLPSQLEVKVLEGQTMIGGETVIAQLQKSK